ncbi:MAG: hypothetical protein AAF628_08455 [Planctomycetota bacterium]
MRGTKAKRLRHLAGQAPVPRETAYETHTVKTVIERRPHPLNPFVTIDVPVERRTTAMRECFRLLYKQMKRFA